MLWTYLHAAVCSERYRMLADAGKCSPHAMLCAVIVLSLRVQKHAVYQCRSAETDPDMRAVIQRMKHTRITYWNADIHVRPIRRPRAPRKPL